MPHSWDGLGENLPPPPPKGQKQPPVSAKALAQSRPALESGPTNKSWLLGKGDPNILPSCGTSPTTNLDFPGTTNFLLLNYLLKGEVR